MAESPAPGFPCPGFKMRRILLTLMACAVISSAKPVMTNETVEAMLRGGVPVPTILTVIKTAPYIQLFTSKEFYGRLIKAGAPPGVADQIVRAMHDRTYNGAARLDDIHSDAVAETVAAPLPTVVTPAAPPASAIVTSEAEVPQNAGPVEGGTPEPAVADAFFGLNGAKLIALERQAIGNQVDAAGYLVVIGKGAVAGAASPVRFPSGELEFVVRPLSTITTADPSEIYQLRRVVPKKEKREAFSPAVRGLLAKASASNVSSDGVVPVRFSRYGVSSWKAAVDALPPGEYAIGRGGDHTAFYFGVD
jgi:hypothetical protein